MKKAKKNLSIATKFAEENLMLAEKKHASKQPLVDKQKTQLVTKEMSTEINSIELCCHCWNA